MHLLNSHLKHGMDGPRIYGRRRRPLWQPRRRSCLRAGADHGSAGQHRRILCRGRRAGARARTSANLSNGMTPIQVQKS